MKNLHFSYDMHIEYSIDVSKCSFTIKCIPQSNCRQSISNIKIRLAPETDYQTGKDGLSNFQIYGCNNLPHKTFDFHVEGDAVTGLSEYEDSVSYESSLIFAYPHGLNIAGEKIRSFYESIDLPSEGTASEKTVLIMDLLNKSFCYKPLVTNVNTSAEEAFVLGHGVCQDYAHILISLLHLAGIPARYVTGFLIGEGASHAWVEILDNGKWIGFDPTNNTKVCDNHIKIGVGRDARDCMINRGVMHGGGLHTQTVKVVVSE